MKRYKVIVKHKELLGYLWKTLLLRLRSHISKISAFQILWGTDVSLTAQGSTDVLSNLPSLK